MTQAPCLEGLHNFIAKIKKVINNYKNNTTEDEKIYTVAEETYDSAKVWLLSTRIVT